MPRVFPPGSEWLYAKLYTGTSTADRILRESVVPLVREVLGRGLADRWFFIRYADPEHHLRLRFHGEPRVLTGEVLPALHAALEPLRRDGAVWRVQLDTYDREIERYGGGPLFDDVEEVFRIDSEAVVQMVCLLEGDAGADARWRLALAGLDRLLGDLGFDGETLLGVARGCRDGFAHEFGVDKPMRIRLGARFRQERADLENLLSLDPDGGGEEHELAPALRVLHQRSAGLVPLLAKLRESHARGIFATSMEEMAMHLGHMFVNRLVLSLPRQQEMVLWDFLTRIHESRAARAKAARKKPPAAGKAADLPRAATAATPARS